MEQAAAPRPGIAQRVNNVVSALREFFITGRKKRQQPIVDREGLALFLDQRASYVAQMSLYGYLRTRAGVRYFELFHKDDFIAMLNVAKWHVWLDCLGDLSVYCGGMLLQGSGAPKQKVGELMQEVVEDLLTKTAVPPDSGPKFSAHADKLRKRIAACKWEKVTDDGVPFSESPKSVVKWAPIIEKLKELDESIVINSVRFRWQEVRRDVRKYLDAAAVMSSRG
ncbi:MAG: hypothetical protein AB7U38_10730 [Hyphomicrobiales bacterium]